MLLFKPRTDGEFCDFFHDSAAILEHFDHKKL